MKRKFILRLLAVVMAASLTATSVPSELFSYGTETVYAATNQDSTTYTTDNFLTTASTIRFLNADAGKYYAVIKTGLGDSSQIKSYAQGTQVGSGTEYTIAEDLNADTSYDVYVSNSNTADNVKFLCTVKTTKISLSDTTLSKITKLEIATDNDNNPGHENLSLVYNGSEQKPYALEVHVPVDGDTDDTTGTTLTASQIASNFTPSFKDNKNAGTATITLTANEDSIYSGSISTTFAITPFTLNDKNTQIKIKNQVYGPTNIQSFSYDGTGQDSVLKSIQVSVDLDGDGTYETPLARNTDYLIDFVNQDSDNSSNNTNGDKIGLNLTTDQGQVTLKFSGKGNYQTEAGKKVEAMFTITKSTPATPTAPTLTATGDLSFDISTADEDQRYTYEYMILTEAEYKSAITWDSATTITSNAVDTTYTQKASVIHVVTSGGSTTATSDYETGCATKSNVKSMSGAALALQSYTKYYVVRRIVDTDNVKGTNTSDKGSVTTDRISLKTAVGSTNYFSNVTGDKNVNIKTGTGSISLDKTYDGNDQKDATVILYLANDQTGSTLKEGDDYTIEYWNDLGDSTKYAYTAGTPTGVKGDKKSAGKVYIWAVGNGTNYSGKLLIGYYEIAKAEITLDVQDSSKPYDGTDAITDLEAKATFNGSEVYIKGITGKILQKTVGTWGISSADADISVNTNADKSENISNFVVRYNVSKTKVEIKKATVEISGSPISIDFGQKITLDIKTNVKEVSEALTYTLSYGSGSDVEEYLDLQSNTGVATLELKDYAAISKATNLKVIASLKGVKDTDNYVIGTATSKEFAVTINPAKLQVGFSADTDDDGIIYVTSYTRRDKVKATVETALAQSITGNNMSTALAGIPASNTVTAPARKSQLTVGNGTKYYFAITGSIYADITYKYYTTSGTELYDVPTENGEYIVKAFLKANEDDFKGNVIGTDGSNPDEYSGMIKLVISGGGKSSSAAGSEGVSDYYENADDGKIYDKNDQLVTNQVVNLDGTDKYVGSDGKVVTGKVLVDDAATGNTYAIAKDGSLIKNTKTTIGGKDYVTDANGAILKDQLATTPSGNTVYVGKDGAVVKNKVVTVGKAKYYANASGRIVKNGFFTTKAGNTVYATASGKLKYGKVFTVGKYKYFAKKSGVIAKSGIFETPSGNKVRATKTGKLYVSTTFTYKGVTYKASKNGVLKVVK
jgi:hypothetical protein